MQHVTVDSGMLRSVAYENGTLEVVFNNGGTYQYPAVSPELYGEMMAAKSKGQFFLANIKKQFVGTRMD